MLITKSTEVGHDHERDESIKNITLGVVRGNSWHRVGDVGDEQG